MPTDPAETIAPGVPTPERVYACLPLIAGNVDRATKEALRVLSLAHPGAVALINEKNGNTATTPRESGYSLAPKDLTSVGINQILVSARIKFEMTAPGIFLPSTFLEFDVLCDANRCEQQVRDDWIEALAILGVFYDLGTEWSDPDGVAVWSELTPLSIELLPPDLKSSGLKVSFLMVQTPETSGWAD